MSDQSGQPPYAVYPPQGAAPQPGAVPPGVPQPVTKKSRTWIWIVLVIVLLFCCVGSVIAGAIGFGLKSAADQAATVKIADAAYAKGLEGLQTAAESAAAIEDPAASAKTVTALDASAADLQAARTAITGLSESEGRGVYLQALDEADRAVETLRAIAAESSGKSKFLDTAKEGLRLYSLGRTHVNASVDAGNKSSYSRSGAEAVKAKAYFRQARAKFVAADAMETAADLEKSIAYVDLQLQKVAYATQMASLGKQGKNSAYNKVVPKFNALNKKIDALKEPEALSDPTWATRLLTELQATFTEQLTKSGALMDRAHKLLS